MSEWEKQQAKAETVTTHAWGLDHAHWAARKRAAIRGVRQRVTVRTEHRPLSNGDRMWRVADAEVVAEPCS